VYEKRNPCIFRESSSVEFPSISIASVRRSVRETTRLFSPTVKPHSQSKIISLLHFSFLTALTVSRSFCKVKKRVRNGMQMAKGLFYACGFVGNRLIYYFLKINLIRDYTFTRSGPTPRRPRLSSFKTNRCVVLFKL